MGRGSSADLPGRLRTPRPHARSGQVSAAGSVAGEPRRSASRPAGNGRRGTSRTRESGAGRPPRGQARPRPRRGGSLRAALTAGKTVVALVSIAVISVTGFAWTKYNNLTDGLITTDVIARREGPKPADGATDILLVGNDSRTDAQGNPLPSEVLQQLRAGDNDGELTDTLILVRIPNDGRKAVGISFPRDSFVDIPGGYGKHKINSAFGRAKNDKVAELKQQGMDGREAEQKAKAEGRLALIRTIEKLTGATIDHYAEVNLLGFYKITKAVGGVDVCLNQPTRDSFSGANFPAGPQTISGGDALAFVRQRHNLLRGDLDRVVRQQVFMAGLARKMLSTGTLTDSGKLNALIDAVKQSVVLDQGWDVLGFARQMQGIAGGEISFQTIPVLSTELQTASDGVAVKVDPVQVRDFVASAIGAKPRQDRSAAEALEVNPASVTVDVRNGTGVPGLAARVLDAVGAQGFGRGDAGNAASPRSVSVVRYAKGMEAAGRRLAELLGDLPSELDTTLPPSRVQVLLGTDYSGPGNGSGFAGSGLLRPDGRAPAVPPSPSPAPQPSEEQKPITANGVVCVN
ncbi:LCP family protein [Longimycelium tulufanense]|uniref:LCP family protein n=1 Tax=Longimycelium tulufanense TaxID=907463 RepID=UPI001E41742B|nr:LCP family protein [Longimycelium tulufanense]